MLDVVVAPNPMLLQESAPCQVGDKDLVKVAKEMKKVMYDQFGIGLAGPQVGLLKRIVVMDCDYEIKEKNEMPEIIKRTKNPKCLVNPEIIEASEEMVQSDEGCLSCPGISVPVMRHATVTVKYYDLKGKEHIETAEGLEAMCFQHEIDHLDGKTLFQTCEPQARIKALQEYREFQRQLEDEKAYEENRLQIRQGYQDE